MCNKLSLRSACTYTQSDQSVCLSLEYFTNVKLLTEHHLEYLRLEGGCTGSSESTHVKMPHCWKSHVAAQLYHGKMFSNWNAMINAFTDYDADKPVLIKLCLQNYFCHFLLGDFTDTGFIQEGSCKIQRLFKNFSILFYSFQGLKV